MLNINFIEQSLQFLNDRRGATLRLKSTNNCRAGPSCQVQVPARRKVRDGVPAGVVHPQLHARQGVQAGGVGAWLQQLEVSEL